MTPDSWTLVEGTVAAIVGGAFNYLWYGVVSDKDFKLFNLLRHASVGLITGLAGVWYFKPDNVLGVVTIALVCGFLSTQIINNLGSFDNLIKLAKTLLDKKL